MGMLLPISLKSIHMNEKLETINNSITEIREIVGAPCANISELPDLVRSLSSAGGGLGGGYMTAFAFSSLTSPNTPSGNTLDTSTGYVTDLDSDWSQTGFRAASTYSLRSTTVETSANWMTFAIFDPEGINVSGWSDPVNLKGTQGIQGADGAPGAQGEKGDKGERGEKGENASSYRTVMVYATTNSTVVPERPYGGSWNLETNEVIAPNSKDECVWVLNADEVSDGIYLWMSSATFGEDGNIIGDWCVPFRLTGEKGASGADGRTIEFIYRLLPDVETYTNLSEHLSKYPLTSLDVSDYIPTKNDDITDTKWVDSPEGISETYKVEVVCSRIRNSVDEPWGEWSNCVIWSKWGEDGQDGDGVEYIYLVTPDKTDSGEITKEYVKATFMPDLDEAVKNNYYQQDGFCFNGDWGYSGYDWTDEPSDVGPSKPREWVSIRKKTTDSNGNYSWGKFSDPKLWGRYAEDGYAYLTSYVFTRTNSQPSQPTGGSFDNPLPVETVWSDTIPEGVGSVWMSMRVFYAGNEDFDSDWSTPRQWTDTASIQIEYTADNVNYSTISDFNGDEESWRKLQEETYGIVWGDENDISSPVWMAVATSSNGVWSKWTLCKVKGEKGDRGENGSSVTIMGKVQTLAGLKLAWENYVTNGDFLGNKSLSAGDGYLIEEGEEAGLLYVYSGGYESGEDNADFDTYWVAVEIKGEKGDSAYLYTAYADQEGGEISFIGPKKYIGVAPSTVALDEDTLNKWSTYTWTKWTGEDGWGKEQIFLLTKDYYDEDNPPPVPTDSAAVKEYLPEHGLGSYAYGTTWMDTPGSVRATYPYCWVATRTAGSTFGEWKGDDNGRACLYSRYSYDGVDGTSAVKIELTNDLAVIPLEGEIVDPDFTDTVYTNVLVYVGDSTVSDSSYTVSSTSNIVSISGNKVTLDLSKLTTETEVPISVKLSGNSTVYSAVWHLFKTNTAFEINPSVKVLNRYSSGLNIGLLENDSFTVEVKKWDGEKWISSAVPVFAKLAYMDGTTEVLSNSEDPNNVSTSNNGITTITLTNKHDISSVRVFVVQKNSSGNYVSNGTVLSFEDIGVVANGEDGKGTEFIYYLCNVATAPANPTPTDTTGNYQNDDWYYTSYNGISWTDEPSGVSESNMYEYVAVRKRKGGVWQPFSDPTLWAKYGEKGDSTTVVEYYMASNDNVNHPTTWVNSIAESGFGEENKYLWNFEVFTIGSTVTETDPAIIAVWSKDGSTGKGIKSITEYYKTVQIGTTVSTPNDSTVTSEGWSTTPPGNLENGYALWNCERVEYTDGTVEWFPAALIGYRQDGSPGESGESTLVAQLSNPAGIIQYTSEKFLQESVKTDLTVLYGTSEIDYSVEINSVELDGEEKTSYSSLVSMEPSGKVLTFTIGSGVTKESHRLTVNLAITPSGVSGVTLYETMTIITQTAGGESVTKVDLGNELMRFGSVSIDLSTTVSAWYGTQSCAITSVAGGDGYTVGFDKSTSTVTIHTENLITTVKPLQEHTTRVPLSVTYELPSGTSKTDTVTWTLIQETRYTPRFEYITPTVLNSKSAGSFEIKISAQNWSRDFSDYHPTLDVTLPSGTIDEIELNESSDTYAYAIGELGTYKFVLYYNINTDNDNYIADTETIPYVEDGADGENAVFYQINATRRIIAKNESGVPKDFTAVYPIVTKHEGSTVVTSKLTWKAISDAGFEIYYNVGNGITALTAAQFNNGISVTLVNPQLIFYLYEAGLTEHTTSNWYDFVEVDAVQDGAKGDNGEQGNSGPVIYPAGEWDSTATYTSTSTKAPYVSVTGDNTVNYYIACGSPTKGTTPSSNLYTGTVDWSTASEINQWVEMETFTAIYADIGVLKHALVGKWVFHGDYMFSQYGYDSGNTYTKYDQISDPADAIAKGEWNPVVWFNAVTGNGSLGAYVDGSTLVPGLSWSDTEVKLGNNFKVTPDGFIASPDLTGTDSYFELSSVEYNNVKDERLIFKNSNGGGFKSSGCSGYTLAVYGQNAFPEYENCHGATLYVASGDSTTGLYVGGNTEIVGDVEIAGTVSCEDSLTFTNTTSGTTSVLNSSTDGGLINANGVFKSPNGFYAENCVLVTGTSNTDIAALSSKLYTIRVTDRDIRIIVTASGYTFSLPATASVGVMVTFVAAGANISFDVYVANSKTYYYGDTSYSGAHTVSTPTLAIAIFDGTYWRIGIGAA